LLRSYPQTTPLAELPEVNFLALNYSADTDAPPEHGEFTLAGPTAGTFKPVPRGVRRLVYDPVGKKYYGLAGRLGGDLVEVNLEEQSLRMIEPGAGLPPLEHVADLSWDSGRARIVIAGLHLFAYVPATGAWSVLDERPEVVALTYHALHDRYYGISGDDEPQLLEFNPQGALIRALPLRGPVVLGAPGLGLSWRGVQLVAAGEEVVLLASHASDGVPITFPPTSYMYVINPKTGKARLAWKETMK
jgi:hypothetical protein